MCENRIRVSTFNGKDKREWVNLVIVDDNHVYQYFAELKNFPINFDDFIFDNRSWEIESTCIQFRNAIVVLVAENNDRVTLLCNLII